MRPHRPGDGELTPPNDHALMMARDLPDLNETVFNRLARAVPAPAFRSVLASHALTLPTQLMHLQAAGDADDFSALSRQAHDLAGFWGTVGADRVTELARRLRVASEHEDSAEVSWLVPSIVTAVSAAWSAITERLDGGESSASVGASPHLPATRRAS